MSVLLPFPTAYVIRYVLLFQQIHIIWEEMYHQHYHVSTRTGRIVCNFKTGVKSSLDAHSQSSVRQIPTVSQVCFFTVPSLQHSSKFSWICGNQNMTISYLFYWYQFNAGFKMCLHQNNICVGISPHGGATTCKPSTSSFHKSCLPRTCLHIFKVWPSFILLISILQWLFYIVIPNVDTQANLAAYISAQGCAKDYIPDLL